MLDVFLVLWLMDVYLWTIIIISVAIAVYFVLVVFFAYAAAGKLLRPPRRKEEWTPRDLGFDYEDVVVKAGDGVELHGWFIDRGSDKTVIAIHGYTSSRWDPVYMKPVIKILGDAGFNVAAFDFRAHGESGGEYTTLGYREVDDYKEIISWLKKVKPDKTRRIGVIGYSMGGAVSIMLLASDDRVDAAVADSPYIDILKTGKRWIMRFGEPLRTILLTGYPLIVRLVSRRIGIDPGKLNMLKYAEKISRPLLIIAGKNDDLVFLGEIIDFCKIVRTFSKNVSRWVTDSRHVESIKDHPEEYREKVVGFFARWLG